MGRGCGQYRIMIVLVCVAEYTTVVVYMGVTVGVVSAWGLLCIILFVYVCVY